MAKDYRYVFYAYENTNKFFFRDDEIRSFRQADWIGYTTFFFDDIKDVPSKLFNIVAEKSGDGKLIETHIMKG